MKRGLGVWPESVVLISHVALDTSHHGSMTKVEKSPDTKTEQWRSLVLDTR